MNFASPRRGWRAPAPEYAVFSDTGDHTVEFVAAIDDLEDSDGRRAIVGRVLDGDDPFKAGWGDTLRFIRWYDATYRETQQQARPDGERDPLGAVGPDAAGHAPVQPAQPGG